MGRWLHSGAYIGKYLNPDTVQFNDALLSDTFVDKTELLAFTNRKINSPRNLICATRPRGFGKTVAASMIASYYACGTGSAELFQDLKIASYPDYEEYANQYHVIWIDVCQASEDLLHAQMQQRELSPKEPEQQDYDYGSMSLVSYLSLKIEEELKEAFPECSDWEGGLANVLLNVHLTVPAHPQFVFVIDEWDDLFRNDASAEDQREYIAFLCNLFKGSSYQPYIALAYLTGIYPIEKYGLQASIGNFDEYTMVDPLNLAEFVGFTEPEVRELCKKHNMPFKTMKKWYDGYRFEHVGAIYNPSSVLRAIEAKTCKNYWTHISSCESLSAYINQDRRGLKQAIALLMQGETILADTRPSPQDSREDVLAQLVHLGYLRCLSDPERGSYLSIPNLEILQEFQSSTKGEDWTKVFESLMSADQLLRETREGNCAAVASKVNEIHLDYASASDYNDENILSSVLMLAYFTAQNEYKIFKEENTGFGRADLFFQPKPNSMAVPMVVELKWNKTSQTAIQQIKDKKYWRKLSEYPEVLLVEINYDTESKEHTCTIETYRPDGRGTS